MRLFIAVNLNEESRDYLSDAIQMLQRKASCGNFTRRENLHLTLVFLGEVSAERLDDVTSAMNRVKGKRFRLSFMGFGKFKSRGGDIHWAGVEKSEELFSLQKQLSAELEKEGFTLENREYSPHLTLGREVRISSSTGEIYGSMTDTKHEMSVSKISLMKSERTKGRLVYTEIYERELT